MTHRSSTSLTMNTALLLNRLSLGLLFFFAGVRKLIPAQEDQTMLEKLAEFAGFVASQAPLPDMLGRAYGYALPFVELAAGGLLVIGVASRASAGVIALMLLSFMIAMGLDLWPAQGPAFSKELVLFTLAVMLTVTGPGRMSLDSVF